MSLGSVSAQRSLTANVFVKYAFAPLKSIHKIIIIIIIIIFIITT